LDTLSNLALSLGVQGSDYRDGSGGNRDGSGGTVDVGEGAETCDFAEHYGPSGFAFALPYEGIRRLIAALGAGAILLVGIVVLHLLR
jgi:hypothetical protein